MLYFYVSVAYTVTNLALAITILKKSRKNLTGRFYFFCVLCLVMFGVTSYSLSQPYVGHIRGPLESLAIFLFSLLPFFFLHFIVIFLRRYDILKSKYIIFAIYFAGLFSYATVLDGMIPSPVSENGAISASGYIYYVTWMSVFFSIGIALLFSFIEGFSERRMKSNMLLTGFGLLMLVLPSPFTQSIYSLVFPNDQEVYIVTSTLSLVIAIYLIFRHKIMVTLYDAIKSALVVMNDIFILTDDRFRIQVIRGALEMVGYDEKDLIGKFLNDIIVEKQYIENYLEYASAGKMRECLFDAQVIGKHQQTLIIDFSFSPVFENDRLVGFVGIARDITHKKRTENALRSSEERFRRLAENADDIIYQYRFSPTPMFEYVCPAVFEVTGYAPGDFYANPSLFLEIVHPEDRRLMEQIFLGSGGFNDIVSVRLIAKNGNVVWTEQKNVPLYDTDGTLSAMEGIARDVTGRKQLEEQLQQAQKLESIGTLAGGVAHDFNNILAIILGYVSILRQHRLDEGKFHYDLQTVEKAVQRGTGIVRELLTMARKTETAFEPIDASAVLKELHSFLHNTFPKKIEIALEADPSLPPILADQNQLMQAFLNLCVNARDAMADGGRLSISAKAVAGADYREQFPGINDERYCAITFTDTGSGIPEDIVTRIFEPFFTTKEKGKGTGLGLAVVYGIIKSHGGFIRLDSGSGKGTSFLILLPIFRGEKKQDAPDAPPSELGGNETIMLVEDEELLLTLAKGMLQDRGYRVIPARDGAEAMQVFDNHRAEIDLVISDIGLPRRGGWELFRHIHDADPNVPVILASGFFDPEQQTEMAKLGAKYFIQKPYENDQVLLKIKEVMAARNKNGQK